MPQDVPHVPDHELLRPIGRGSYGKVWLARSATGAYRAVKVVYRDSFDHDRPYEREFAGIQQYEPISRASDTQVDILHIGRNDEFFYYVMELADDQKVGQRIDPATYKPHTLRSDLHERGHLPLAECLEIGIQLTRALDHLHQNGLVHRDVKPSNIVFVNGKPKLADPGLVAGLDATKSLVGTEGYIPADGMGTPVGDIYSLGKVLYEASSGRDRMDYPELASDLRSSPDREGLVQFNEIILKACDEDRKRRYPSASAMRLDLERIKAGQPLRRPRRLPEKWKIPLTAACGFVVLALAVSKWSGGVSKATPPGASEISRSAADAKGVAPSSVAAADALTAGLVSWWKADGDALDSAGAHHGTLMDGASFGLGKEGQAFFFNGHSACVAVPPSPDWALGGRDFTIAFWTRFWTVGDDRVFLACENRASIPSLDYSWRFCLNQGVLQWQVLGSNGPIRLGKAAFNPAAESWHHLAVTRAGARFSFYVDGARAGTATWNGKVPDLNAPLTIGNAWGGPSLNGLLDDIRIYDRALTEAEISSLTDLSGPANVSDRIAIGSRAYQRSEFIVSTSFIDANSQGNVAALAGGRFLVAWHQGLLWHCYAQAFDSEARPLAAPFCLSADVPGDTQWGPCPAPMPDGGFVACWGHAAGDPDYASDGRCFDAAGIPVSNRFTSDLSDWTSVAAWTNGDFLVTSIKVLGPVDTNNWPVMARRFHKSGFPYGPPFQVSSTNNGFGSASAAWGTDGRFAVAWSARAGAGRPGQAFFRVYPAGDPMSPGPELHANSPSVSAGYVRARYNPANELWLVWLGLNSGRRQSVFLRRFDSNLTPLGPEVELGQAPLSNWEDADLSIGSNGEAIVSWYSGKDIFARLLDQTGKPIGREFRVNRASEGSHRLGWEACAHSAMLDDGSLVFTWAGMGSSGNGVYLTFLKPG
jgi:hypothetical protein